MKVADGFEEAFVGIGMKAASEDVAVYDYDTCASVLISRDGMSADEAYEYLDFNVVGAYVGPDTPMFLYKQSYDETMEQYSS